MCKVIDEISGEWIDIEKSRRVAVYYSCELKIFGYVRKQETVLPVVLDSLTDVCLKAYCGELLFSRKTGYYFSPEGRSKEYILKQLYNFGMHSYPYTFNRKYEAVDNFKLFKNKQKILDESIKYKLPEYMPYTFGVEFETSQGFIPEDICFRDGLIPLRDGSITGLEYSTVILEGNQGISLLRQQMDTLKKYVCFNKDCALHVHLGGFPLVPEKIFNLYILLKSLERTIENLIPTSSFYTSTFKDNGKDYCKKLQTFGSFKDLYAGLVGRPYLGSLVQSHPCDVERKQKWKILTRYNWCNFINLLCYKVNKTVEFRFLRSTYSFKKLLLWLYIFNGLMRFSESEDFSSEVPLSDILRLVYPEPLFEEIYKGIFLLIIESRNQNNNGDLIGTEIWRDEMFDCLDI